MDRFETAQQLIMIMDILFKDNNMSLVIRNGKPAILDHELDMVYSIEFTGSESVE